jgi:hypothetical protein
MGKKYCAAHNFVFYDDSCVFCRGDLKYEPPNRGQYVGAPPVTNAERLKAGQIKPRNSWTSLLDGWNS